MTTTTSTSQRPVHTIRIGMTQAAVWEHANERGRFYKVTLERRYRENDAWKSTASFGVDDLLRVAKAADNAETWIRERQRANDASGTATEPDSAA